MIKNKPQLAKAQQLLREARAEISEIGTQYSGTEKDILLIPLERERERLVSEIDDYHDLLDESLDTLVTTILSKPVLIGNVGPLLAKLRMASDLTQSDMASRIGWKQANLSRFEGENYSSQTIAKIVQYAGALGVYLHVSPSLTEHPTELVETSQQDEAESLGWLTENVWIAISTQSEYTTDNKDTDFVGDVDLLTIGQSRQLFRKPEAIGSST